MIEKALAYLVSELTKQIESIQENLADDNCRDFPEYKKACGEVKGLLSARMLILDLQKRVNEEDEWNFNWD